MCLNNSKQAIYLKSGFKDFYSTFHLFYQSYLQLSIQYSSVSITSAAERGAGLG